jgi:hypothetical protein
MRKLTIASALIAALFVAGPIAPTAHAANDGNLGATSTGDIDITLTIPNLARISRLDNIVYNWIGGDVSVSESFCVFSSTRLYTIQANSANGTGTTFRMTNAGNGQFVPYEVDWTDTGGTADNMDHGVPLASQATTANSVTCNNGDNTTLTVRMLGTDIASVPAATYTDTLTLVVTPQ